MTTLENTTISHERLMILIDAMVDKLAVFNLSEEEYQQRLKAYVVSLAGKLEEDAKLFAEALLGEQAIWFRPDWTPAKFLDATTKMSDEDRCRVVLLTRDIGLISWFVNARAGRILRDEDILLSDAASQRKINQSEVSEIEEAINLRDSDLFLDAISDTLLTTAGFAGYVNIAITQNFVEMVEANFTRIAGTFEHAAKTKAHWEAKGIPCYISCTGVSTYPVLVTEDIEVEGVLYPKNKFLKGVGFRDAVPSQKINFIDDSDVPEGHEEKDHGTAQTFDGH